MENFIKVWTNDVTVFLNANEILRISFAKDENLRQSERVVKVQFKEGSTGTYIGHRSLEAAFSKTSKAVTDGED